MSSGLDQVSYLFDPWGGRIRALTGFGSQLRQRFPRSPCCATPSTVDVQLVCFYSPVTSSCRDRRALWNTGGRPLLTELTGRVSTDQLVQPLFRGEDHVLHFAVRRRTDRDSLSGTGDRWRGFEGTRTQPRTLRRYACRACHRCRSVGVVLGGQCRHIWQSHGVFGIGSHGVSGLVLPLRRG